MGFVQLSSGGKDSIYSMYLAMEEGVSFSHLLTAVPHREDSYMFHFPNARWAELQARAMGVSHSFVHTEGVKEEELIDLEEALASMDIDGVCSGAVKSSYQHERITALCDKLGLECIAPLWQRDERTLIHEAASVLDIIIIGVYAWGLGQDLLGRHIDSDLLAFLDRAHERYGVNYVGEGGEYETYVVDAPQFSKRIRIIDSSVVWERDSGYLSITDATLENK
jgi:ABC transporter with metal-binding/Fe-S-binding domain ATP-binding protein